MKIKETGKMVIDQTTILWIWLEQIGVYFDVYNQWIWGIAVIGTVERKAGQQDVLNVIPAIAG